jgi:phosphate transport system permease protein
MSSFVVPSVSPGRRRTDRAARGLMGALTLVALVPLVLVVYYLLYKGLGAISSAFFNSDPTGNSICLLGQTCDIGGVKSAIIGTLEMVALASLVAIPIGVAVALYLVEYGKTNRFASIVRYLVDVMTGVPSIVFGLFVYSALVASKVGGTAYAGWKGAVALSLLMLPVVVRSSEVVLLLVPDSLREAALALGAPRWKMIIKVVLPTALPGMVTGMLLAIARAAGETAPLLFAAGFATGTNLDPTGQTNALPLQIFSDITSAQSAIVTRAWGAALTLVFLVLILTLIARLYSRRSRLA